MRITIIHLGGRHSTRTTNLTEQSVFMFGRDPLSDILIEDKSVSRKQALVSVRDGRLRIENIGGNAFEVNGKDLPPTEHLGCDLPVELGFGIGRRERYRLEAQPVADTGRLETTQILQVNPDPERTRPEVQSGRAALVFEGGRAPVYPTQAGVTIGRDPGRTISFPGESVVSRAHARIDYVGDAFHLIDEESFNGTFLNGERITARMPVRLATGDRINFGFSGPSLKFLADGWSGPVPEYVVGDRPTEPANGAKPSTGATARLLNHYTFADARTGQVRPFLTIGRSEKCDIRVDDLRVSERHARIHRDPCRIDDLGSTNGTYLNGRLVTSELLSGNEAVQIGPYLLRVTGTGIVLFETRSTIRVDVRDLNKTVTDRKTGKPLTLLDRVRLSINPNEFVGLLGPSGAGKSTLMTAMNGMTPADKGEIQVNGVNLYRSIEAFKRSIGFVPQKEIILGELSVEKNLRYVARLRLASDVDDSAIDHLIEEVLNQIKLLDRRDTLVRDLSGGQQKRVAIGVELITKPSLIYLDEPTSGLDPGSEARMMSLFQELARGGRTIVLTTHAMENIKLFDKVAIMMRGKLIWFGPPSEINTHFGVPGIIQLFEILNNENDTPKAIDHAERRRREFEATEAYRTYVQAPLASQPPADETLRFPVGISGHIGGTARQAMILAERYIEVMKSDSLNLWIILGQAPLIAFLTALVVTDKWTRDFPFFILSLAAVWFGCSNSAREIIKEKNIYERERMVNLGLVAYVASKFLPLFGLGVLQCLLLFWTLFFLETIPGNPFFLFGATILAHVVGIGIGLTISAFAKSSEMATSLVPLILIPQILFGGLVLPNEGLARVAGYGMPAMWSFDLMKQVALLEKDVKPLRGPKGEDDPVGELGRIKTANQEKTDKFQKEIDSFQKEMNEFKEKMNRYTKAVGGTINAPPQGKQPDSKDKIGKKPEPPGNPPKTVPKIEYPPDEKKDRVGYQSEDGSIGLDLGALFVFAILFLIAPVCLLRRKDVF